MKKLQKSQRRKGFTLTELAIVIAVIAILIAVLVPTFVSLINKANESADQQAVKSMNTALATDEALNGKKTNPSEAMEVLKDAGYNVENYQALDSNNVIYWNSETNRTLLYSTSENAVIYPSDAASTYTNLVASNLPNYWYTLSTAYKTTTFTTTATTTEEVTKEFFDKLTSLSDGETLQLTSNITLAKYNDFKDSDGNECKNYTCTKGGKSYYTGLINATKKASLESAGYSNFVESSKYSSLSAVNGNDVEIDLNGYTLADEGLVSLENGSSVTIRNGTYIETSITDESSCNFNITSNSALTLDSVTMTLYGSGLYPKGDSAQVNVINSTISTTNSYCVGTNAATVSNYGVIITLSNSTLTSENTVGDMSDSCTVMLNVKGTLNIDNCIINGERQGVIVRAGTANITNTTITCSTSSPSDDWQGKTKMTSTWGSGNNVAMGAVVVGNNLNGAYLADAIVTMSGCTVSYTNSATGYDIALFAIANNKYTDSETGVTTYYNTSVTVSDCTFSGKVIELDQSNSTGFCETDNSANCTCDITGYKGTIYTKWNSTAWE